MSSSQFLATEGNYTPYRATLTSFGSAADGKAVKRTPFTLEATSNGAAWSTIDADWYRVRRKTGYVEFRDVDDNGDDVDIDAYIAYQDLGNQAFRVTYTVKSGATSNTYTTEALTFALADPYISVADDGSIGGEFAQNLWVQEIHADFGDIGGWYLSTTQIISDSGNVFLDSSVPSIGLGATGYQTGTGFWVGKSGGSYKLSLGDASSKQLYWDGSALTAGGFTIGADYLRDAANTFGLASTVTGGDDVRFWAGDSFANRASAPLQLYESGYIFAKDIVLAKGSLTGASGENGYGYAVNPLFLCHYDGARPYETDYSGSVIGHLGQAGTYKYNTTETRGMFRKGKFGKAVQVAEATTNQVLNPSAEAASNFAARGTATVTRDTGTYYIGATSYKIVLAAANDGIDLTTAALANAAHYVTFWATGAALSTLQVSLDNTNWNAITQFGSIVQGGTTWTYCGVSIASAQANGSTTTRIRNTASSGTFYIDAIQVEQRAYPTPYCDGSLGGSLTSALNGHSWSGTANASASSRIISTLDYAPSGNVNVAKGTISFWYYDLGISSGFPCALSAEVDSNNRLTILLASSGNQKPYCDAVSGGVTVSTATGATAASGGWNHIAVTWTTGALKLYLNGTQSGATATYVAPAGTLASLKVGYALTGFQVNTWIDDLCILPIALTDHEIKSIYYSDAPLMLAVNSQELRLSGAGLGDVFGNANGLFARGADGTPSFGLLNGTVNITTWGGDTESFDAGDFIFGSNKSGKSNLVWDASAGAMYFRVQTTKKISLDTNGTLLVGSNITAAATTGLAIFSGAVSYNSETMAAGNVLIGDNTASTGLNVLWDGGAFYFRVGTTVKTSISAGGIIIGDGKGISFDQVSVTVGSGNIDLSELGDTAGATGLDTNYIRISSSTGAFTINRIVQPNSGQAHLLIIHNNSANNMTLANGSGDSAEYREIATFGAAATTGDGIAILVYNENNTRWDVLSIRG